MDPYELVRIVLRRWYVTAPFLLAGVIGAVLVMERADDVYEVSGSVLVTRTAQLFGVGEDRSAVDPGEEGAAEEPDADDGEGGIVNATLLAEVINLDGRATTAPAEGSGPSLRAFSIGNDTVRIDVYGNDAEDTFLILQEKVEEARGVAGSDAYIETIAMPPGASPSSDQRGAYQASALLRIDWEEEPTGEGLGADFAIRVVSEQMLAEDSADLVATRGGQEPDFDVVPQQRDQAPIVTVSARADSPEGADAQWEAVRDVVDERLTRLQDLQSVPEDERLGLATLVRSAPEELVANDGRRLAAVIFGMGALLGIGVALAFDATARRRHQRPVDHSDGPPAEHLDEVEPWAVGVPGQRGIEPVSGVRRRSSQ